jgi:hypothetical protein
VLEFYKQRKKNDDVNSNKLTERFYLQQYALTFEVNIRKINVEREYENHFMFQKHHYRDRERFLLRQTVPYAYGVIVCFKGNPA